MTSYSQKAGRAPPQQEEAEQIEDDKIEDTWGAGNEEEEGEEEEEEVAGGEEACVEANVCQLCGANDQDSKPTSLEGLFGSHSFKGIIYFFHYMLRPFLHL